MSQRKLIRWALRDLIAGLDGLAGKVFASRTHPVDGDAPGALPCVLVYTDRDPGDRLDNYRYSRELGLRVVVIVRADDAADDLLDDICEQIEVAVENAMNVADDPLPALNVLADDCVYVDTALTYTGEDGRADLVHAEMTFTASYVHAPEYDMPDLTTVTVSIDMSSPRNDPQVPQVPDGQIDASAVITLSQ